MIFLSTGRPQANVTCFSRGCFFYHFLNSWFHFLLKLFTLLCKKLLIFFADIIDYNFLHSVYFLSYPLVDCLYFLFFFLHSGGKGGHILIDSYNDPTFKLWVYLSDNLFLHICEFFVYFLPIFDILLVYFSDLIVDRMIGLPLPFDCLFYFTEIFFDSILDDIERYKVLLSQCEVRCV